jgi:hypothetical protein
LFLFVSSGKYDDDTFKDVVVVVVVVVVEDDDALVDVDVVVKGVNP